MTKKDKWSIQISKDIHDKLKDFCREKGYTMCVFVERAIMSHITGSTSIK